MNLQNHINSLLKIALGLSPSLIILSISCLPLPAQTTPNPNKPQTKSPAATRIKFPSGPDRGTPQTTSAGGRRGTSCIMTENGQASLTALMPTWDNQGQTFVKNPNLYIYIPKNTTKTGDFRVIDDQGNDVYKTDFVLPSEPGIVELSIPASAALKTDKKYFWYFTLICNPDDRSQDEYISGSLKRIQIASLLNSLIQQATPIRKAEIYAKKNIWYDTISNIASVRTKNPELWAELLKSVGLEEFAKTPFVNFGTPKP